MNASTGITRHGVVFAFSGCTPITGEYARSLACREPAFDHALHEMDEVFAEHLGWSLRQTLLKMPHGQTILDLPRTFPLVVALQIAMVAVLRERGIGPCAVIGLSAGEVSSAYVSGAISLRDALCIAADGGRLMQGEASLQRMMLAWASEDQCRSHLTPFAAHLAIGGVMEEKLTIISGQQAAISEFKSVLAAANIHTLLLPFPWGVHTPLIARGRQEFETRLRAIATSVPVLPIVSTSLGRWAGSQPDFAVAHWWHLFSSPAQFLPAARLLIAAGARQFVEISSEATMSYSIPSLGGQWASFEEFIALKGRYV
ncbi:MAG: acyltransferase domain-containing protein [Enterobacterales bacterium]|uniref:acyltransferase domain-containing protein n=1 Tax=Serratia sp. (in: enterobacteria) TaxID=616 RepID=UPI003F40B71E